MRCFILPCRPRLRLAALAIAFAVALAAPAQASMVTSTFENVSPGQVVTIYDSSSVANGEPGWAGQYNFMNASGYLTGPYGGFCIDIGQNIYGGVTTTFNVADLANAPVPGQSMGSLRANLIEELWSNDYAFALTANKYGTAAENAAAFQVAIWEIINETNTDGNGNYVLDVKSGQFYVKASDPTALNTANTWLSGLELDGKGGKANLIALTSDQYQDYVVQAPTTATPAPSGLVLGGMAAASAALAPVPPA
jgi:hypothetical protein